MGYERRQGLADVVPSIILSPPSEPGTGPPILTDSFISSITGGISNPLDAPTGSVTAPPSSDPTPNPNTNTTLSTTSSSSSSLSSNSTVTSKPSTTAPPADGPTPVRTESQDTTSLQTTSYTTFVTKLNGQITTVTSPLPTDLAPDSESSDSSRRTALIAGITIGVIAILLALLLTVFLCRRRLLRKRRDDSTRKKEVRALLEGEEFDDEDTFIRNLAMRSTGGPPVSLSAHSARGLAFGHAKPMHINLNVGAASIPSHHPKDSTYSTLGSGSATSFSAYNSPEIAPANYPYASFRRPSSPTPSLLKSRVSDTGSIFREEVWPPPEVPTFVDPIEANSSQVNLSGIVDEVMGPGAVGVRSSSYSHADKGSRASGSKSMSGIHERGWTADSMMTSTSAGGWSVVNDSISTRRTTADSGYSDPFKNPSPGHSRSASDSSSPPLSPSPPISSPTFSSSVSPVSTHIPTNPQATFTKDPTPRNSLKTLPPGALKPYVPSEPAFSPSPPFVPSPQPHIPSPPSSSHHSSNSYSHISDTPISLNMSTPTRSRGQPKVSSPLARAASGDAKLWLGKRQVDHERSYSAGNVSNTSAGRPHMYTSVNRDGGRFSQDTVRTTGSRDEEGGKRESKRKSWKGWMKGR